METIKNDSIYVKGTMHNKYFVEIKRGKEVVSSAIGYNRAYSKDYIRWGYIDRLVAEGTPNLSKNIEPYPENNTGKSPDDDYYDITNYWDRVEPPTILNGQFVSSYIARVRFLPTERSGSGTINAIQLYGGGGLVSSADLTDIEGEPIILSYTTEEAITITAYIYFVASLVNKENTIPKVYLDLYPVKWFGPGYSVLGGSCGGGIGQEVLLQTKRHNHNNEEIDDGYLPMPNMYYYAVSKAPVPKKDPSSKYLMGGVNDYQIILPTEEKNGVKKYKNQSALRVGTTPMKGLIRSLVLPGLGLMDAKEITGHSGIFNQGIFQSNVALIPSNKPCYIPKDCIQGGETSFMDSLYSMSNCALYGEDIDVKVRRYLYREEGNQSEMETIGDYVPLNEPFFSDLSTDARVRRRMGFSQHVPFTENDYCGAESVIPCLPSGPWINETLKTYGYYIVYISKGWDNSNNSRNTYLKANYIVPGQIITVNANDRSRAKVTFPCKLQYSYDGNEFFTAIEITHDSTPFIPHQFNTVVAPIWRLIGGEPARNVMDAHNTTHSDPNVSKAAGVNNNGYDPYFLFVGYDVYKGNPDTNWSSDTLAEKIEEDNNRAIANIPNNLGIDKSKIEIRSTPNFRFWRMGYVHYPDIKRVNCITSVPYNCHPNDAIYLCGEIPYYSGGESNDG